MFIWLPPALADKLQQRGLAVNKEEVNASGGVAGTEGVRFATTTIY
jgi:hypothetical protein